MSGTIFHPFVLDNTAGQETIVGIGSDSEKYGVGISSNSHITGIQTVDGFLHAEGGIQDTAGNIGSSGKVLSSTGSGLQWIDPSEGSTANAVNVGTNLDSTNADQFVAFVETSSGNNPIRVDGNLKYNPSTNVLTAPSFSGNLTGTIQTAAQTNITSLGTLTGLTVNGNITQSGASNYIRINGGLQDKDGEDGDSGQVLSSTGTQVNWVNVGDLSAGSASQVAVSDESTDTTCFPLFVTASTGNQSPKSGSNLTFNSSTGQLNATKFSGELDGTATVSNISISGYLKDKDGQNGNSGQVLSSTGTQVDWVNVGSLAAGSAAQVAVSDESSDTTCFPLFTTGNTGNQSPKSGSNLTFNSSTGQLNATKFVGDGSGLTGISDTTYDLLVGSSGGDVTLTLDASEGDDDTIQIGAGANISFAGVSATGFTINATNTNTQLSNEQVQDIVGGMVSGNTESGITVTYQDSDGTLDFSVGTLNQNTTGNAATATALANARTIAGSSFNGSANIDIDYDNLTNKPTIPTNNNQLTNGAGYVTAANAFPSGGIIIWSGAVNDIPTGWVLCDGNNSTPDLRNRFIVGAGTGGNYSPGNTGGSADATLVSHSHTINNHTHSFSGSGSNTHSHGMPKGRGGSQASIANYIPSPRVEQIESPISTNNATISISISGTTGNPSDTGTNTQGSSATNANLPPYYALCYIMKT